MCPRSAPLPEVMSPTAKSNAASSSASYGTVSSCTRAKIASLRRFKDDVKEVQGGYECGIGIEKYNDIKVGDTVECYFMQEIKPALD